MSADVQPAATTGGGVIGSELPGPGETTAAPPCPPATTGARDARTEPRRRNGVGWFFAACVVLTFANFAAWAWATPLYASPDEPTQVVHAAAVVRGQLVGTEVPKATSPTGGLTGVTVPKVFATGGLSSHCYAFQPTVTAACSPPLTSSTKPVTTTTYVGRYPPLYYLIVGLPSLAFVSSTGVYFMRLASALLNALVISLALLTVALWSRRTLLMLAVMVAATPMTWFLGGMVNPSGFEICCGIFLWTAGLVLVLEHPEHPPPGLVAFVALATCLFLLARPISPLWVAMIYAFLCLLGGWRAVRGVLRSRVARWSALPVAACAAFAMWWVETEHALDLTPVTPATAGESRLHVLATVAGHTGAWLQQMVGVFGWLDTTSPLLTYVVWATVVVLLVALGLSRSGLRRAAALLLLVAAVLVVPIALTYAEAHRLGLNGQGRYWLPLAVGVPLVSVALFEGAWTLDRVRTPVAVVLATGIGVASIAAYLEALRRYAVGVDGPLNFLGGAWHPPFGLFAAAAAGSASIVLLLAVIVLESRRRPALEGAAVAPRRPVTRAPGGHVPRAQGAPR